MADIATGISVAGLSGDLTIEDALGAESFADVQAAMGSLAIDPAMMNRLEPWLAAMTIMNVQMQALGYSPEHGIDTHFMQRAVTDGKPVLGLETLEEQISLFDSMSPESQRQLLAPAHVRPRPRPGNRRRRVNRRVAQRRCRRTGTRVDR